MTIPGIDVTTAATLMATIGQIDRFASPRHLIGYLGLDPRIGERYRTAVADWKPPEVT